MSLHLRATEIPCTAGGFIACREPTLERRLEIYGSEGWGLPRGGRCEFSRGVLPIPLRESGGIA